MSRFVVVRNGTGTEAVYTCVLSCVRMKYDEEHKKSGREHLDIQYVHGNNVLKVSVDLEGDYHVKMCQPDGGLIHEMRPRLVDGKAFTSYVSAPEAMVAAAVRVAGSMELEDWWEDASAQDPRKLLFDSIPEDFWGRYAPGGD